MMYFFNIFAMFVGFFQLTTGLSCDVSGGKHLECGNNVQQQDKCPKTCCFNQTVNPPCYFNKKGYGPIKHANGLCINVQGTQRLIWSRDCTSRNAFFLLSYDYPPYHVTTGKCILPLGLNLADPGKSVELLLTESRYCGGPKGRYRPIKNGNLDYFHTDTPYKLCIGGSSVVNNKWQPNDNESVFINEKVCDVNNSCKFNYVYERKIENGDGLNIQCDESCSNWVIEMRSAEFGVLLKEMGRNRKPCGISSMEKDCLSTSALSLVQNQCNGKKKCSFTVRKEDFLSRPSSCSKTSTLLVYYTCKTPKSESRTTPVTQLNTSSKSNPLPVAPSMKAIHTEHKTTLSKIATTAEQKTASERINESNTKDSVYLGIIASLAVGAFLLIVLVVILLFCIIRRKRNVKNIYTETVDYKKRMKEEKNLIVNMDEDCVIPVPKDIKTNQNAVTKINDQLRPVSEEQTSSQDLVYQGLDLSKRDENDEHYQSLNANVDDTTYQGLDATQMNKEDDYQSLNANVDDAT